MEEVLKWKSKPLSWGEEEGADGEGGWEEMVKGDGVKGEEVLLAGLAAFGWPLVLGVNIGRRASSRATHRHRRIEKGGC